MKIDLYRSLERRTPTERPRNRFRAIPTGNTVPESWADARYFKTIDLEPGDIRIGAGDATTVLANIAKEGWSDMGEFGGA